MLAEGVDSLNSLNDFKVGELEEADGGRLGDRETGGCWREGRGMERNGGPYILNVELWITDPKRWGS